MAIEVGLNVINSGKLWRFVFGRHFFGTHCRTTTCCLWSICCSTELVL